MNIGIIGSGRIGSNLARHLVHAGHEVLLSARDPAKLSDLVTELGSHARAGTFAEAARFGEVVVLTIHWQNAVLEGALPEAELFAGKVVVDAMNPYKLDGSGFHDLGGATSSGRVADLLPRARLVKAFNTIFWEHLRDDARPDLPAGQRRAVFLAGDDADAKRLVAGLVQAIGFAPVDTGSLRDSTRQEPGSPIYNVKITSAEAEAALGTGAST